MFVFLWNKNSVEFSVVGGGGGERHSRCHIHGDDDLIDVVEYIGKTELWYL